VVFVLDTRWYPFPLVTRWYPFLDHFSVVFVLDAIPSTFGYSVVSLPGSFICDDNGCHAKTLTRRVSVLRLLSKNFM
jgi:hypothetical protein